MKQQIKNLATSVSVIALAAIVCAFTGCAATTTANSTAINTSQKEMLLTQAGFKPKTVTTPKQQQQLAKLAVDQVSAVKYKGNLFYVYPTAKEGTDPLWQTGELQRLQEDAAGADGHRATNGGHD